MGASQMALVRNSVGNGGVGQTNQTIQNSSNSNRGGPLFTQPILQQQSQQQFKQNKASASDKKNFYQQSNQQTLGLQQQNTQNGLFPRISNLRNEVTVLFKNSSNNQNTNQNYQYQNQPGSNPITSVVPSMNNTSKLTGKQLSSPRIDFSAPGQENFGPRGPVSGGGPSQYQSDSIGQQVGRGGNYENMELVYDKQAVSVEQKNRIRLKSNVMHEQVVEGPDFENERIQESDPLRLNQYTSNFSGSLIHQPHYGSIIEPKYSFIAATKDDFTTEEQQLRGGLSEDQHQLALTPQIASSHSNKRQLSQQQRSYPKPALAPSHNQANSFQQQQQQFFSRRTGSQKEGTQLNILSNSYQISSNQYENYHQNKTIGKEAEHNLNQSNADPFANSNMSPISNAQIQKHLSHMDQVPQVNKVNQVTMQSNYNSFKLKSIDTYQGKENNFSNTSSPTLQEYRYNEDQQKLNQNQESTQQPSNSQQPSVQQDQPLKIPVICGFHKRVLLLTSNVSAGGVNPTGPVLPTTSTSSSVGPSSLSAQTRRIRNKNPNCNHNNNFVFYQPHYNNVKYDDSHKKKEDVLRKVFFKECVKEEEKRVNGSNSASTQNKPSSNDPIHHLKLIEDYLCESLFADYELFREGTNSVLQIESGNITGKGLMQELGLDTAFVAHKAFLLALIKAGKIINENMLKVLHEFKSSSKEFDNECIYCKYSQYALRESSKISKVIIPRIGDAELAEQGIPVEQNVSLNLGSDLISDQRIEHLVKMFQSQLFKRSFINTSLMIIQKKMNEKFLIKQKAQGVSNQIGEATSGGVSKIFDKKKLVSKDGVKKANINNQSLTQQSTLESLANQIQKLVKNLANPKDKEKYLELKEKYYKEFLLRINQSNQIQIPFPKQGFTPFKYYIGKGNNSMLVRTCLKQRFWWSMGDFDEWDEYNFLWTQWKSNKILNCIKTHADATQSHPDARSGLTSGGVVGLSESVLSTQMTVTDKDSNSSAEALLAPAKKKRASTIPANALVQQQVGAMKKFNSNSISNSAQKNQTKGGKDIEIVGDDKGNQNFIICNHMENNFHLSNKKAIYYNMKVYYEAIGQDWYDVLPLTFHIKEGVNDKEFNKFCELFKGTDVGQYGGVLEKMGKTLWIVKPGENTNRGCGINVCKELQPIKDIINNTMVNGQKRSYIIQKYIEKPMLYKQRKFDIRCYTLLTSVNGNLQGYWYNEGYFRTSSKEFNLKNCTNRLIHLTNDAVQKKSDDYGKFEAGNKLSYPDFQKYLDSQDIKLNIIKDIVPQIKKIATDTIKAVSRKIDPHRRHCSFEIFGYDFMIDEDFKPWLIEVNTNPCLELSSPYLARLIPAMVENAIKIAIDPLFPPPPWPNSKKQQIPDAMENKFEIVFNEFTDGPELKNLPIDDTMNGIIEEEELEDEGSDGEDEDLS